MIDKKYTAYDISMLAKNHKDSGISKEIQSHIRMRHAALSEDQSSYDPSEEKTRTEWENECPEIVELFSKKSY